MKLISKNIGKILLDEIKSIESLSIVVAYFSPDSEFLKKLNKIRKLEILVSDEFTAINPYSLESLEKNKVIVRYLPSDTNLGKLHSKVYYGQRKDGSKFIIVSSANLTYSGMFSNSESSIIIDSKEDDTRELLLKYQSWFNELIKSSLKIDYDVAKKIYNSKPPSGIFQVPKKKNIGNNYWVLKTTSGGDINKDYWSKFKSENVIALGWGENLSSNPLSDKKEKVIDEISKKYPDASYPSRIYSKIMNFFSIKENDYVIIQRGYSPNQDSDVFLYGIAQVTKSKGLDRRSNWWVYKHEAKIINIETEFPKQLFTSSFQKESLLQAIHKIDKISFHKLTKELNNSYNIKINI